MPFLTGKCFFNPSTAITGVRWRPGRRAEAISCTGMSGIPSSIEPLRVPAGCPMPGPLLLVGGKLRVTAVIREGAPGRECAAGREIVQRRHHAGDFLEPLD